MHHFLKTVLLSCALLALGAMPSQSAESLRCVSAANPSGTWYIGMGAVGKAYTNMNPGTDVTMLPGGGATNAPRLASRAADMGVAENSMLNAFKTGLEPYKAPTPKGIATVANLWDRINYQIVSPVSSPVKDLRDLKTMKNVNIGVGSTGGSTEKIFRNILKEYGITYEDIKKNGGKVVTNGFDDIANMVKDGQIDVFVWIGPGEAWFIVDVSGSEDRDPVDDFEKINEELRQYSPELAERPMLVAANKVDLLPPDSDNLERLRAHVEAKGYEFYTICAATTQGTRELMKTIAGKLAALPPVTIYEPEYVKPLAEAGNADELQIERYDDLWVVSGKWLQKLLNDINFDDYESRMYFDRQLRKSGLFDRLEEQGIEDGDTVSIYDFEFDYTK